MRKRLIVILTLLMLATSFLVTPVSAQGIFDKECPDCHGTGELNCPDCNGVGKLDCLDCEGTGKLDCPECYGTGKVTCTYCNGSGYVTDWTKIGIAFAVVVGAVIGVTAFTIRRKKPPTRP